VGNQATIKNMIALFTDFGWSDPYLGQLHARLAHEAPGVPVIDLFHAVPNFDVRAAAYLLPAYAAEFPAGTVFVCVVDPGVGGARTPIMVRADERWYVGPDNGLFSVLARRAGHAESFAIRWQPARLSVSFHGRDLFAPVAARLARGEVPESAPAPLTMPNWPAELAQVVYIDHYGNAITGLRGDGLGSAQRLGVGRLRLRHAPVFSAAPRGKPFWYVNSNGLVEIAVREGNAARQLKLRLGTRLQIMKSQR
jgi:hypothetical protein